MHVFRVFGRKSLFRHFFRPSHHLYPWVFGECFDGAVCCSSVSVFVLSFCLCSVCFCRYLSLLARARSLSLTQPFAPFPAQGSASNFRTIAKSVSESTGRETHMVSLRNHGESPWGDDMSFSAMASDVLQYVQNKGLGSAVLVGHSLGGKVAIEAALEAPDAVQQVMVVDIAPVSYSASGPSSRSVGSVVRVVLLPSHPALATIHAMFLPLQFKGIQSIDIASADTKADVDAMLAPFCPEVLVRQFVMQVRRLPRLPVCPACLLTLLPLPPL